MPQFDFANVFWPQLAWLALVFSVLFFGVVLPTLPKLGRAVDARENKIGGDISAAEIAKAKSDELAIAYQAAHVRAQDDARAAIADAKTKAALSVEKKLAVAGAAIDGKMAKAQAELAEARNKAVAEIETIAADNAADIVEKLSGTRPVAALAQSAAKAAMSIA
jgi:F-type H+-transporting ATPase subunit b